MVNSKKLNKESIMDFLGIWSEKDVKKVKRMIEENRKRFKIKEAKW